MAEASVRVRFGDNKHAPKAVLMEHEPIAEPALPRNESVGAPNSKGAGAKKGGSIYHKDEDEEGGPLTLHEAAEQGLGKEIARMVERSLDFDINQRDRYGRTALMWAAEMNHRDAAETLIDLGADRRAADPVTSRTALHLAARAGAEDMLHVLLDDMEEAERKEYVNEADKNGITPVYLARQKGDEALPVFEYLMECGARYNQQAWKELGDLPPLPPGRH